MWIDNLDMCNSNMIKMYKAQGEFEVAINFIGGRQNELIRYNAKMMEWLTKKLSGDKTTAQPQASISNSLHLKLVTNMNQLTSNTPSPKKRERNEICAEGSGSQKLMV